MNPEQKQKRLRGLDMAKYTQVLLVKKTEHQVKWVPSEKAKGKINGWTVAETYASYPEEFVRKNYSKKILD